MPIIKIDKFDRGIDVRRSTHTSDNNRLRQAKNVFVTTGYTVRKRPGLEKVTKLESGTKGLISANEVLNTFNSEDGGVRHSNPLFTSHLLNPAGDINLVYGGFSFNRALYISVQLEDKDQHYYLEPANTWDATVAYAIGDQVTPPEDAPTETKPNHMIWSATGYNTMLTGNDITVYRLESSQHPTFPATPIQYGNALIDTKIVSSSTTTDIAKSISTLLNFRFSTGSFNFYRVTAVLVNQQIVSNYIFDYYYFRDISIPIKFANDVLLASSSGTPFAAFTENNFSDVNKFVVNNAINLHYYTVTLADMYTSKSLHHAIAYGPTAISLFSFPANVEQLLIAGHLYRITLTTKVTSSPAITQNSLFIMQVDAPYISDTILQQPTITPLQGRVNVDLIRARVNWDTTLLDYSLLTPLPALDASTITIDDGVITDGQILWELVKIENAVTDSACPQSPIILKSASKVFCANGQLVNFSATNNALDWSAREDAGFIAVDQQAQSSDTTTALGTYQSQMVVVLEDSLQTWNVDPDPQNITFAQSVENIGTQFSHSIGNIAGDVLLRAPTGYRSVSTLQYTDNLSSIDIGSPIDRILEDRGLPTHRVISKYANSTGQYLCTHDRLIDVYSFSRTAKISAWSVYEFPDVVDDIAELKGVLYFRIGDDVFRFNPKKYVDDYPTWHANRAYSRIDRVIEPSVGNGMMYALSESTGDGMSGNTEPIWDTPNADGLVVDNDLLWKPREHNRGDRFECLVESSFIEAKKIATEKYWNGFEIIMDGDCEVAYRFDQSDMDIQTEFLPIGGVSLQRGIIPVEITSTGIAPIFRARTDKELEIHEFAIHFDEFGVS